MAGGNVLTDRTRYILLVVLLTLMGGCLLVVLGCFVSVALRGNPEPVPVSTAERDLREIRESYARMDETFRQMDETFRQMDRSLDNIEDNLDWLQEGYSNSRCLAKAKVCGEP